MKKLLALSLCILLICALPLAAHADESDGLSAEKAQTEAAEEAEKGLLLSKRLEEWVIPHLEEICVVVTMIISLICQMKKHKLLSKSMGVMNHNAVTIAEQSSSMMSQALASMENTSCAVAGYDAQIAALLEAHRSAAEDKALLEKELRELKTYLKTATEANLEFSNELAELLNLANIPNFKKEEIGARHLAAVNALAAHTVGSESPGEVIGDVREEA